jgi:hypothetical protein
LAATATPIGKRRVPQFGFIHVSCWWENGFIHISCWWENGFVPGVLQAAMPKHKFFMSALHPKADKSLHRSEVTRTCHKRSHAPQQKGVGVGVANAHDGRSCGNVAETTRQHL